MLQKHHPPNRAHRISNNSIFFLDQQLEGSREISLCSYPVPTNHDNLEIVRASLYPTCMIFAITFLETGVWVKCVLRGFRPHTVNLRAVDWVFVCPRISYVTVRVPAPVRYFSRNEGPGLPLQGVLQAHSPQLSAPYKDCLC